LFISKTILKPYTSDMKKIITLIFACSMILTAQNASAVISCDTLSNLTSRDTLKIYLVSAANGGGYLSGNNGYGDKEKAEKFSGPVGSSLSAALFGFGWVTIKPADSATTVTVNAYDATGAGGSPGATIATATVTLRQIAAAVTARTSLFVSFTTPFTLTAHDFFVSVVLPTTTGDTVAVATNKQFSLDGRGWEKWSDNTWNDYQSVYGTFPNLFGNDIQAITCGGSPLAAFQSSLLDNCGGSATVQFYNTSSNGVNSFSWVFQGGTPPSSTSASQSVSYTTPGTYNVTLIAVGASASDTLH
jgi:hypothetical protein